MKFTIGWFTNRLDPRFEWFFNSLSNQLAPDDQVRVIAIDFYANTPLRSETLLKDCREDSRITVEFHPPAPNVWNGPHRLTKENHFNAAGARNTAVCLCEDEHLVIADDLSVLMPGWVQAVKEALRRGGITLGCYRKVYDMRVNDGHLEHFRHHEQGMDHRVAHLKTHGPQRAYPSWFYGCSVVLPIEAVMQTNGFPEALCASLAYEDTGMSLMLSNNGWSFLIDPRMMTYESEELHHQPGQHFVRLDPCRGDPNAVPRDDMSHAMLRILEHAKNHPNYFGPEGIRGLRQRVLRGEPFPIMTIPEHCWFTGKLLKDL